MRPAGQDSLHAPMVLESSRDNRKHGDGSRDMGKELTVFLSEDCENRSSRFVCLLMKSVRVFPFLL